jgi:peptide/nickel transport system permease protein
MGGYIIRRGMVAIAVMVVVSVLTFLFTNVAVDPAINIAGEGARPSDIELVRVQYGFDQPLPTQYGRWLKNWVSGDFGTSFRQRRPVAEMLAERFPTTIVLGVAALLLALALAVPLGVLSALHPNSVIDRAALSIAVIGIAMPSFWMGMLLIMIFSMWLQALPISGNETAWHYVLPVATLAYYTLPPIMRLVRAGMIEIMQADYIRTARAKGLRWRTVVLKHALRNALVPVVAVGAVQLGHLLGGSIVVESVFSLNGVGLLAWEAIRAGDLPVIQAILVIMSLIYVGMTFLADLLNAAIDPRIRVS